MKTFRVHSLASALGQLLLIATLAGTAVAQAPQSSPPPDPAAHAQHAQAAGDFAQQAQDLMRQLAELRAQVAQLQVALAQGHASGAASPPTGGMKGGMQASGMSKGMRPMGQQQPATQAMPGMAGGTMQGMGGMSGGSGMQGMMQMMGMGDMPMGGMGAPATAAVPTALPGFPGASRIYHIGSTGFFLDHPEHISLTLEQQTALAQNKERALLQQADLGRKIEQAEQELWVLTGSDQPDALAIEGKVREVAKLQADQRVAFIRIVGEAAALLTDEQRKQLAGLLPPQPAMPNAAMPMSNQAGGMAGGGMKDM